MEILIVIAIILGIIILPRMFRRPPEPETGPLRRGFKLTGWMRLAILVSLIWAAFFALYLSPWNHRWDTFFYLGIGPVVLFWGIFWIIQGFRHREKQD